MEDYRTEQKEALETLAEFNERLVKNMKILVKELSGKRLDDTDKFLRGIIDAVNWEIEVLNRTMDMLNEEKIRIDKEPFNACIMEFAAAVKSNEDAKLAAAVTAMIPEFESLGTAVSEVLS